MSNSSQDNNGIEVFSFDISTSELVVTNKFNILIIKYAIMCERGELGKRCENCEMGTRCAECKKSDNPRGLCFPIEKGKKSENVLIIYLPSDKSDVFEGKKEYVEFVTRAYAYLTFRSIPIIIKCPNELITAQYFIVVATSAFKQYPILTELMKSDNDSNHLIISYCSFNYSKDVYQQLKNAIQKCFLETGAIGKDTITLNYCQTLDYFEGKKETKPISTTSNKIGKKRPKIQGKVLNKARSPNQESPVIIIKNSSEFEAAFEDKNDRTIKSVSFLDIGDPERTMYAATKIYKVLFLTSFPGSIQKWKNKSDEYIFSIRSKDYSSLKANSDALWVALSSSVVIIPVDIPCDDFIETFCYMVKHHELSSRRKIKFKLILLFKNKEDEFNNAKEICNSLLSQYFPLSEFEFTAEMPSAKKIELDGLNFKNFKQQFTEFLQ